MLSICKIFLIILKASWSAAFEMLDYNITLLVKVLVFCIFSNFFPNKQNE